MGAFNINITGVGGHGCERKAKPGDRLQRCGRFTCPDCLAFEFVQRLRQAGMVRDGDSYAGQEIASVADAPQGSEVYFTDAELRVSPVPVPGGKVFWRKMQHATFTHWPGDPSAVVDDMLSNTRVSGQF